MTGPIELNSYSDLQRANLELTQKIEELKVQLAWSIGDAEFSRTSRWHSTYNAALTGIFAGDATLSQSFSRLADDYARSAADLIHGPLPKKKP